MLKLFVAKYRNIGCFMWIIYLGFLGTQSLQAKDEVREHLQASSKYLKNYPDQRSNLYQKEEVDSCIQTASSKYRISKRLLLALAYVESSGNSKAISSINKNGSFDMGLMQINSEWLPKLFNMGILQDDLMNPCTSAEVAGWILAQNIQKFGNTWAAIGHYNSNHVQQQEIYIAKVYASYKRFNALETDSIERGLYCDEISCK